MGNSNKLKNGINFLPAYQMPGLPFVTSSVAGEVPCVDTGTNGVDPIEVQFPYVTKFFTIRNTGINELRVGFTKAGVYAPGENYPATINAGADKTGNTTLKDFSNYYLIPSASNSTTDHPAANTATIQTFNLRVKSIFLLSNSSAGDNTTAANCTDFSLIAGLSTIAASEYPTLTGSVNGVDGWQGVG